MKVHLELMEGFHGTVFENLEQGLDRQRRLYDKSKILKSIYPEIDLAASRNQAMERAYYVAFQAAGDNYDQATELAVLLKGRRVNSTTIEIESIFRFRYSELFYVESVPSEDILEEITAEYFEE
jgi:hypothetical protein